MERKTALMINALALQHNGNNEALKFLPQEWQKRMQSAGSPKKNFNFEKSSLGFSYLIDEMHYSWLLDGIQSYSSRIFPLFVASLDQKQKEGLTRLIQFQTKLPVLPSGTKSYLKKLLAHSLHLEDHVPFSLLPESSLDELLTMNKSDLVVLIQKLGLHDLAKELLVIVDKNRISQIYHLLTKEEGEYLSFCMRQPNDGSRDKTQLLNFANDPVQFARRIQESGLKRLGLALSRQDSEWLWHFTRRLDKGRGQQIERWSAQLEDPTSARAIAQLTALLKRNKN
ncbi:MAG: hypothetical protein JHC93_00950 [Parachlamydiales bacterium]|nr:hypothetical protein [Parachlamydiales bacterium]